LGSRKGIQPVKNEWWGTGVVICLERGADLHVAQLMPLPLTVSCFGTTEVSQYQKGKTNLDFTEARDNEWQWHQLGCMQVCTSLQTDNHTSTSPLVFLQAVCPSCRPTNSIKALKARHNINRLS